MRLTKISDIRRAELRRAAFEVLQREGMAGATLVKVGAHGGAPKRNVVPYFAHKKELVHPHGCASHMKREGGWGAGPQQAVGQREGAPGDFYSDLE